MSYDFIVYTSLARVPAGEAFALVALAVGVSFASPTLDLLHHPGGFVPVVFRGTQTGFELSRYEIPEPSLADYEEAVAAAGCDAEFAFGCHGDDEIEVARVVARLLAEASEGFFCDPQTGELVKSSASRG